MNCCVIIFCFNTQPPEGGWTANNPWQSPMAGFNTQPPEGGWQYGSSGYSVDWSFNTQPPEGGWNLARRGRALHGVSTHSRLKAAGKLVLLSGGAEWFQHTAA